MTSKVAVQETFRKRVYFVFVLCVYEQHKLEKKTVVKMCRSTVYGMLQRVCSPERLRSPSELYITEEHLFQNKNPKVSAHMWKHVM